MAYGISRNDFCRLTPAEFSAAVETRQRLDETRYRAAWERCRTLATFVISPHLKKGHKADPRRLLPMPWDKKTTGHNVLSRKEAQKRYEELIRRKG